MPPVLRTASQKIRNLLKPPGGQSISEDRLRNDRQSYFAMTRVLAQAQLEWRDAELTSRLWKEVAERGMDRGRILQLLLTCDAPHEEEAMQKADVAYLELIDPRDP